MLNEAIDQVERAAESIPSTANRGAAAASDSRLGLRLSRAVDSEPDVFQTAAALCAAAFERHSDGGAQSLAGAAGLTRSDARGRIVPSARPGRPVLGPSCESSMSIKEGGLMSYPCGRIWSC